MAPSVYNQIAQFLISKSSNVQAMDAVFASGCIAVPFSVAPRDNTSFAKVSGLKMADGERLAARITYNFKTDMSYHWVHDRLTREILVLRFTGTALPGAVCSADSGMGLVTLLRLLVHAVLRNGEAYGEDQWSARPCKVDTRREAQRLEERDAELQSSNRRRTTKIIEEEEEEALAQAMAEAAEDEVPDDGAIEIGSDEEYQ
ncbi:hypothetical protein JB92DRAFT_3093262 [Gautieria morchelliformis]|nr:hypothetical protein JB92DRAFT_3093262 [Gautieria morchelliformis]